MIQKLYSESVVHRATVFRRYNTFSEGRKLIYDQQRNGRRTMTRTRKNIAHIADISKENHRFSCRLIAEWTGIPKTIVQQILRENLQKWKLCLQFVPQASTAEQKEQRLYHAYDLTETIKSDANFLDSTIGMSNISIIIDFFGLWFCNAGKIKKNLFHKLFSKFSLHFRNPIQIFL